MAENDKHPTPASLVPQLGMAAYRAPSLFQPHRAREALADAHAGRIPPLLGYFCGIPSTAISKIAAQLGFDVVWIDWEHAAMSVETMTQMVHDVQFVSEGRSMALVRVPGHDHASIGYALDAGASIMIPQIDTVEQARAVVSFAKFGSKISGTRSAPPCRFAPGIGDICLNVSNTLYQNLNRQAAIIIQIESLQGIKNLDSILTEVGHDIDSVWLGTYDARASMEFNAGGAWGDEKEWLDAVELYEATLRKHNMPASGLAFGDPATIKRTAKIRSFLVTTIDFYSLIGQGLQDIGTYRKEFRAKDYSEVYDA